MNKTGFKKNLIIKKISALNSTMQEYIYLDSKKYKYITDVAIQKVNNLIINCKNKNDLSDTLRSLILSINKDLDQFKVISVHRVK